MELTGKHKTYNFDGYNVEISQYNRKNTVSILLGWWNTIEPSELHSVMTHMDHRIIHYIRQQVAEIYGDSVRVMRTLEWSYNDQGVLPSRCTHADLEITLVDSLGEFDIKELELKNLVEDVMLFIICFHPDLLVTAKKVKS